MTFISFPFFNLNCLSDVIFFQLCRGALEEMAEWEQKMRDIVEWESTTTDEDTNSITRDETGPTYKYEDIC